MNSIIEQIKKELDSIESLSDKIEYINNLRYGIHLLSPFKEEPIDYVKWVVNENVVANDYNPNKVAPPEMELLEVSIMNDGYTQPIVTWDNQEKEKIEVIDGFHRSRVGKESKIVKKRVLGFLPVVNIRKQQSGKNDRIASTIRHNRARGKHQVDAMSEIVLELKNRNWSNKRISHQLGMDEEEVLRLCQVSGLDFIFSDSDFSKAWESSDTEIDFEPLNDNIEESIFNQFKIPNEGDKTRIFHTYEKWECFRYGFYNSVKDGFSQDQCENEYLTVLGDANLFSEILTKIISEWKYSCEHYLSNRSMNRIAWLGQAAVCYHSGIPSKFCAGWNLLSEKQKEDANSVALVYLNKWLVLNNLEEVNIEEALIIDRQIELY
jgi:ParB-like chromosome segregation protein Spo0J